MIKRSCCCICKSSLTSIYTLQNVPIQLSCIDAPIYDSTSLSFSQCNQCLTIQLDHLIPLNILYANSHNYMSIGKIWNDYFQLMCDKLLPIIKNKTVLEIGDPSAKIANRIAPSYNKWYIVEPNKNNNISFADNIEFIESFFDDSFTLEGISVRGDEKGKEKIDVIVHSHLFEHIYEPNLFLTKCYHLLDLGGEMFFGVPNIQNIADEQLCPFLGIFFEHTVFLNKENISFLLESNGFEVIEIIDYLKHSTIYHVKKIMRFGVMDLIGKKAGGVIIQNYYPSFFDTLHNYQDFVYTTNQTISSSNLPVYIFGASYNTQFLLALGINVESISGILDNSKDKQNKYLFGYDLLIHSPEIIKDIECIVILKNGYYINEIKTQLLGLNNKIIILS